MQLSLFYSYFDLYFMDHVDIGYSQSYVRNKTIDRLIDGNIVQYILMLKFCLEKKELLCLTKTLIFIQMFYIISQLKIIWMLMLQFG